MKIYLYQFQAQLKKFIIALLCSLTFGVFIGLAFLYYTTSFTPAGAVERYNGSPKESEFDIVENYPKPVSEIFITTHNHVIVFTFIFSIVALLFYFNSVIEGFLKTFIMVEPFISIIISFSSLWLMRFVNSNFIYLMTISSTLIYLSYFFMVGVIFYELLFKKNS